jgi:GUN4-like/TIR domain
MVGMAQQPIEVFFSYSREDKPLRDKLEIHLSSLKRQGVISAWHDRQIVAGSEWEEEIDRHMRTADIILLLISPDFVASKYCYEIELPDAIARHEAGEAYVVPILLRPVAGWKRLPFAKLQVYPSGGKPITEWRNQDSAFVDVAEGIQVAVDQLLEKRDRERLAEQAIAGIEQLDQRQQLIQGLISTPPEEKVVELREIRKKLLTARSRRDLHSVQYQIEEFLSRYPNDPEGRSLRSEVLGAVDIEQPCVTEINSASDRVWRLNRLSLSIIGGLVVAIILLGIITPWIERHPTPKPSPQTNLKGNYAALQALLKAKDWKGADDETQKIMLQVGNNPETNTPTRLDLIEMKVFNCPDLIYVDQLWREASSQKFGYRVQVRKWESGEQDPQDFAAQVGWIQNEKLVKQREDLKIDTPLREGQLPWFYSGVGWWGKEEDMTQGAKDKLNSMSYRLSECRIDAATR